jgi:hypothetical protein
MPDERYAVTLSLTNRQLRLLRQAVFDFADGQYYSRMRRIDRGSTDTRPSVMELDAEELSRLVIFATTEGVGDVQEQTQA